MTYYIQSASFSRLEGLGFHFNFLFTIFFQVGGMGNIGIGIALMVISRQHGYFRVPRTIGPKQAFGQMYTPGPLRGTHFTPYLLPYSRSEGWVTLASGSPSW